MPAYILERSAFLLLFKKLYKFYFHLLSKLRQAYRNSRTQRGLRRLFDAVKTFLKFSFLGRMSQINEQQRGWDDLFGRTRVLRYPQNFSKKCILKFKPYFKNSQVNTFIGQLKSQICFLPRVAAGKIIIVAILTNVIISVLLRREIGVLGWVTRGLFLFLGACALYSQTSWRTIKNNSLFLKLFLKKCAESAEG